jgi:septum formation protein
VLTGVAVAASAEPAALQSLVVESLVRMRPASAEEIRRYVATGEPLDKAGAYALQGEGRGFVLEVSGSESNVIGLPLDETLALLRDAGLRAP